MTFELWLMHKGEELEVKLADYKEEKSRFMCRGTTVLKFAPNGVTGDLNNI